MKKYIFYISVLMLSSCLGPSQGYYQNYDGISSSSEIRLRALEEERRRRDEEERRRRDEEERRRLDEEERRRLEEEERRRFMEDASSTLRYSTKIVMNYLFNNIGRGDLSTLRNDFSERNITYYYQSKFAEIPIAITWTRFINWVNDRKDTRITGYIRYENGFCTFICTDAKNVREKDAVLIKKLKTSGLLIN